MESKSIPSNHTPNPGEEMDSVHQADLGSQVSGGRLISDEAKLLLTRNPQNDYYSMNGKTHTEHFLRR